MLSIKFTKKERSVDQRIEKATIGPDGVEFEWHHEGERHVIGLTHLSVKTLIGNIKNDVKKPIQCNGSSSTDRNVTAQIDGDNVKLDYAEHGTAMREGLSVKSLLALKAFLS